jgi:hypothetical protein
MVDPRARTTHHAPLRLERKGNTGPGAKLPGEMPAHLRSQRPGILGLC